MKDKELSPVEWLESHYKLEMEMHGEIHISLLDKLFEKAKEKEEKLKDFDTSKEWKNETFKSE